MEEQQEIWKPIVIEKNGVIYDYTGLYEVSNMGRVRSLDMVDANGVRRSGKIRKCNSYSSRSNKYLQIGLTKNKETKSFYIHRLVATMFIPNPENLPEVNHRDENKLNNCVDNLEWCDRKHNCNYGTRSERRTEKMKGRRLKDEHKQKLKENHADFTGAKHPKAVKVICIEYPDIIFGSIKEAQEWCHGNIKAYFKGKSKYAGIHPATGEKLHWMRYDEWLKSKK